MNILTNYQGTSKSPLKTEVKPNTEQTSVPIPSKEISDYKPDLLDIASEKIINKRDITDTVTMPRAIFKGYLCFTAGTAIGTIAGMLKEGKCSKILAVAGSILSIFGTFNFVKPFLIKDKSLTETGK